VPEVPAALDAICLKALARQPAARYASMAELAADLRAFLGGSSKIQPPLRKGGTLLEADPFPPPKIAPVLRRKRRWVLSAALVVGALALVAVLSPLWFWPRPVPEDSPGTPPVETPVRVPSPRYMAIHRATLGEYQDWVEKVRKAGCLPVFVNGYTVAGQTHFAAIALPNKGEYPWETSHDLTSASYQNTFNTLTNRGFRLLCVSGYPTERGAHYAALWIKGERINDWFARHDQSLESHWAEAEKLRQMGLFPVQITGYRVNGELRFSFLFTNEGIPRLALYERTAEQYQKTLADWSAEGYRPINVSAYPQGKETRFAVVLSEDNRVAAWRSLHNLTPDEYQKQAEHWDAEGFRPLVITGYDWEGSLRYAAIWVKERGE
jgi:hypothetical protein